MHAAADAVIFRSIGTVRTPFKESARAPLQPMYAEDAVGDITLLAEFTPALEDIEQFERLWLLYVFDRARATQLHLVPCPAAHERGLFATRVPHRPNPIGLSLVRLLAREGNVLRVLDVDMLDGTPLLDIKPYVPLFDARPTSRAGWLDESAITGGAAESNPKLL
jgi:tRNA (adenine37-N6)-methyltransferase